MKTPLKTENTAVSDDTANIAESVGKKDFSNESAEERTERIDAYAESTVHAREWEVSEQWSRGKNLATIKQLFHTVHFQKKSDGKIVVYVEGERTAETGAFAPNETVGEYDTFQEAYTEAIRYLANEKRAYEAYPKTFHQYNDLYNERHPISQSESTSVVEGDTKIAETTPTVTESAQKETSVETKGVEAAYNLGKLNTPRESINLVTPAQEAAYNAGRIEHIKNMPTEKEVTNIDSKPKQEYTVSGKMTDKTRKALDKKSPKQVVGTIDGRAYISDGRIAIPIAETDVEFAKTEWGLRDNENIARVVEETANNNEYVPISSNPIEGALPGNGSVYLFTTDDGKQIAIKKKYAKYFDGYNLSATFYNGKPYAIKATDADGNFAGLVMGIRPGETGEYNITDTKEVSMKSFKKKQNKPVKETSHEKGGILNGEETAGRGERSENGKTGTDVLSNVKEEGFGGSSANGKNIHRTVRGYGLTKILDERISEADVVEPKTGSVGEYALKQAEEYGIVCYVLSDEAFARIGKKADSYARKGQIYLREGADDFKKSAYIPHEVSHVMKQINYTPYMDFIGSLPEKVNVSSQRTREVLLQVAEHRGLDGIDFSPKQASDFWDEFNATVYGTIQMGKAHGVDYREFFGEVFYDLDAYVAEMDKMHEDFKAKRTKSSAELQEKTESKSKNKVVNDKGGTSKPDTKVVETKTKLDDFGEKIGGARKDQWNSRGLLVDDLESMNDRERDKNVKKDNVWKRPNYRALVEAGGDRGLLWAVNEIRKSLQQNVYYGYKATDEIKTEKQKLFIETTRAIQSMAENAKTKADFEAMGEKWLLDNGYLEDTGRTYNRYAYTQKFSQNPALSGSNYLNNIRYLVKNFDNLTNLADRNNFAVDAKTVVPKGFSIIGGENSVSSKLVNGEWVKDTSYAVAKGRSIIKDGFATREEALEWLKQGIAKKKGKTRFVPKQLQEVHRKGPDYRRSKSVAGQDYIDTFGFKGGEFGNWMNAKDRQVSLDYGFDALKDLADALGIEDTDISFGGNLNIAFGARGQGLSGAAAHYENERRVINLTKMNGAGSLGHEWFHALDDFIGGYTSNYATDKYYSLPEKTKQAIRDLITTMQYKDATQEETDLAKQKKYEQAVRGITYTLESEFKWVEAVENGTFQESNAKYYKKSPTIEDAKKYRELFNKLIETGEMKYVEELSALRKEVNGRVIPKEVRDSFVWRLPSLNSAKSETVQLSRKMTDFYTGSRRFGNLHSKDGDYWDSTVEMSARAFACYVADKTNKQNDYLSAHSDAAITLDADKDGNPVVVRAFPVGEERTAINKAFDNLIEALKADGFLHERTQTEKPPEATYETTPSKKKTSKDDGIDKMYVAKETDHSDQWTAERVGDKNKKPKSLAEIIEGIRHDFEVNITVGHIRGSDIRGTHTKGTGGIRTKKALDLPTIAHELGHELDEHYGFSNAISKDMKDELVGQLPDGLKAKYSADKLVGEGISEYVRKFLQNRETAAIDYPLFTDHFLGSLSPKDLALVETLADDVNAYYSLDADTATSSIKLYGKKSPDARTFSEKMKAKASMIYQAWVDANHAIKSFDIATGSNIYKLANNAAYADAIAGNMISGGALTDKNGRYVAPGLMTALHGIRLNDKDSYFLFGEYLTVKHGPERLKEGMRTFSDDRKNSTAWMNKRQAEIEQEHPEFIEVSERLYDFWDKFMKTWAVSTGIVSKSTYDSWRERWEYYVPFNRVVGQDGVMQGAKKGFVNQSNPIKKAKGSGRDIIHPVDNMIVNMVKMIKVAVQNNVAVELTEAAKKSHAYAALLEKVPMPLTAKTFDMTGIKESLTEMLETGGMNAKDTEIATGFVDGLDDILVQYSRGKAHGDVIFVLKNGKPEAWKINDAGLLDSLAHMSPKQTGSVLDAYAVTSRFMTANITGTNLVWSIFSNLPRDMMTYAAYSPNKNVVKMATGIGSAYINKFKGDNADPYYKEFLALGGGQTSVYTSDRKLTRTARKKMKRKAGKGLEKVNWNPLAPISFIGDTIESGPRYATYRMCREMGMSEQEAFYEAMDITVNFRRGGKISRDINKVVPFFNANVQGLDKFRRWITAEEYAGKANRKKAIVSRTTTFVTVSAALGALVYALNNGDDEREKEYEQLSNYIKNSYWNIPIGDGKYFSIPKPRELGVLSSFFETCMEYGIGDNDHAFDEFYSYAAENFLPAIANDIAQVGTKGVVETGQNIIGSFGVIGVFGYLGANRDFLGRPIVSSGLQNLEPKDQYTSRTSKIAYWIGQATNSSPQQIDFFFQQTLGGWWKNQKALFPVGEENVDYSLGVKNTYVKDNQYSTDLTNWLYDRADATARAKSSNPTDIDKAISAKWDNNMTSFYGKYYKQAKNKSETTATRGTRQLVLDMIREYQKGIDNGYKTEGQKAVEAVCKKENSTEFLPSVMPATVKDGNDKKHELSDVQYVEYQTDYLRLYWEMVEDCLPDAKTDAERAEVILAAKKVAREKATERTLARIGAPKTKFTQKYEGVSNEHLTEFFAGIGTSDEDGSVKKTEVVDVINGMDVDSDDAWALYLSKYDSKGARYARDNGVDGTTYIDYLDILGDNTDGKSVNKTEAVDAIQSLDLDSDDSWALYLSEFDDWGATTAYKLGVPGDKYIDFRDNLDKVDEYFAKKKRAEEGNPNDELKLGSYTQEEAEIAIRSITGISNRDRAILWQSMNKNWKVKNNPWGAYLK